METYMGKRQIFNDEEDQDFRHDTNADQNGQKKQKHELGDKVSHPQRSDHNQGYEKR